MRWLVYRGVGLNGFFGLGQVADNFSEFGNADLIFSGGFGVRYRVNDEQRINIGIDVGFANDGDEALYFRIGEAF